MKENVITGIGSRKTPAAILAEMVKIGKWCKRECVTLRSGHAEGSDYAFESGAQEFCTAYIPWSRFNSQLPQTSAKLVVPLFTDELMKTVSFYHPAPDRLSFGVQKLMARNACQVLGSRLNSPTEAVVCYTQDGRDSGGTGQALRIAAAKRIPILNMYFEEYNTSAKVIAHLNNLLQWPK